MRIKFVVYLTCTTNHFQSFNTYRKGNHWHQQLLSQGSNRISSFGFWLSWRHWRNHVENLVDFTDQHPSKQWWLGRGIAPNMVDASIYSICMFFQFRTCYCQTEIGPLLPCGIACLSQCGTGGSLLIFWNPAAALWLNHGSQWHVSQLLLSFTPFYTSKHAKTNDCKRIRSHVIQPFVAPHLST